MEIIKAFLETTGSGTFSFLWVTGYWLFFIMVSPIILVCYLLAFIFGNQVHFWAYVYILGEQLGVWLGIGKTLGVVMMGMILFLIDIVVLIYVMIFFIKRSVKNPLE